jgi:prolyl-tRNA synthetase
MILNLYGELMETQLAIPVMTGRKSEKERFAGAVDTYTLEALMPDGKALQMGTSHNLGQNFSKPFGIKYRDRDEKEKHVWQTSWGISTRLIGALVMTHGDDKGLVLPPNIAPVQAIIIPIIFENTKADVIKAAEEIRKALGRKVRAETDLREECSAGWKFNEWEMKGVPLRIEVGPKDVKSKQAVLVRRDTGAKRTVRISRVGTEASKELASIQESMLSRARESLGKSIEAVDSFKGLEAAIKAGKMAKAEWCGSAECEDMIKDKTSATIRLIIEGEQPAGKCIVCGSKAKHAVYVAKQY